MGPSNNNLLQLASQHQSYRLGRGRGPDCLPAGREGAEQAVDETAAGGPGDRQRGGGDGEGGRDPGEAQEVLERGPASRIHLNAAAQRDGKDYCARGGGAAEAGTGAAVGRSGWCLECEGGKRIWRKARDFGAFASRGGEVLDWFLLEAGRQLIS